MLEEQSCARTHCCRLHVRCAELAHENCYVVSQHPLTKILSRAAILQTT